jgi:hypothetical protein
VEGKSAVIFESSFLSSEGDATGESIYAAGVYLRKQTLQGGLD